MKDRTLWSNREAKFKPRNLQAARITFPAKGFNCPPPESLKPRFDRAEQMAAEAAIRDQKIAEAAVLKSEMERQQKILNLGARLEHLIKRAQPKHRNLGLRRQLKRAAKRGFVDTASPDALIRRQLGRL